MDLRIGQSQVRFEDDRLLRGSGRFTADTPADGEAAMVVFRSAVAAGRIAQLDIESARQAPGVLTVLTGKDLVADGLGCFRPRMRHPAPDRGEMFVPAFRPLATDTVQYVGEPIAIVVARSQAQAEDAAEQILLDIEDRPAVLDCIDALAPDAPRVWEEVPGNLSFVFERGDRSAVEAAFETAVRVVEQRLRISRVTAVPLEPRNALASFDPATGQFRLELGTQAPHRIRTELADLLDVLPDRIRVVARDCGGSFGMKNLAYPEYALALWAARRVGRPIRWTASRLEAFQSDAHARDQVVDAALALDADGQFLALRVRSYANLGAYIGASTPHPPTANVGGLAGVYRTPAIHVEVRGVHTNTQMTAPYRGAGRPEATYVIERMIDLAAAEMGIDRAELRRRNLIRPEEMPFKTGLVFTYDSGDFPSVLARTLDLADWAGFETRRRESRMRGRLRGIGIANPIEIAGGPAGQPNPEFARVAVSRDGSITLYLGSMDSGQGHGTAFRQLVSQRLGVDTGAIRLIMGDTGAIPQGTGTFGSRTLIAAGTAITAAVKEIVEQVKPAAADALEVSVGDIEFDDGWFSVVGTDRRVAFAEAVATATGNLEAEFFVAAENATFPNGCHICEVEVEPDTGAVCVVSYVVVDDVGTVINPMLVKGQIQGGVAQGLGQALLEQVAYEPSTGQLLSATLMDYALPRAGDLPSIAVESLPVPTRVNPLGAKGAGEAGTVGALSAVMSAVCHALEPLGIRHIDMPATPARIWQAIEAAR